MPPSVLWGTGKPGKWREIDLVLIEALALYEGGLCKGCGQPIAHTSEIANTREFEAADDLTCRACEVIESRQAGTALGKGQKLYVRNHMSDN